MTEDQMRANMLLAKASWYFDPVADQLRSDWGFDTLKIEIGLWRLHGPESAAAADFVEALIPAQQMEPTPI